MSNSRGGLLFAEARNERRRTLRVRHLVVWDDEEGNGALRFSTWSRRPPVLKHVMDIESYSFGASVVSSIHFVI